MTNQQGAPEALFYADALDRCAEVDFDHIFVPSAAVIRRLHAENERLAALVEAQQPAPSAAAGATYHLGACIVEDMLHATVMRKEPGRAGAVTVLLSGQIPVERLQDRDVIVDATPKPSPTPQADSQPAPVQKDAALSQAARDVLAERQRQISGEGWTPEHDDKHSKGEMAEAAACYAASASVPKSFKQLQCPGYWPWAFKWWKPSDARRDLVKAGALILAELERIDRAARKQGGANG